MSTETVFEPGTLLRRRLVDFLISEEDMRLVAYLDKPAAEGGVWTIAGGVTRYPDGRPVKEGDTLPDRATARQLTVTTLEKFYARVADLIPGAPPHVVDACASLAYNIGVEAFETSTCRKRILGGDIEGAAAALKWFTKSRNKKTGQLEVLGGLVTRRENEAEIMLHGWDGTSGPAVTAGSIVATPPKIVQSKTFAGIAMAAIGGLITALGGIAAAFGPVAPLVPSMLGTAKDAHDALVQQGVPESWAICGGALVLLGSAIAAYAHVKDRTSGRVLPKEQVQSS